MLTLPVVLMSLTIGIAQWAQSLREGARPYAQQLTHGAPRALVGLPSPVEVTAITGRRDVLRPAADAPAQLQSPSTNLSALQSRIAPPEGLEAALAPSTYIIPVEQPLPVRSVSQPEHAAALASPAAHGAIAAFDPLPTLAPARIPLTDLPASSGELPIALTGLPDFGRPLSGAAPDMTIAVRTPPAGLFGADGDETQCRAAMEPHGVSPSTADRSVRADDPEAFGLALAAAAREQLDDFVIYNDRYTRIAYPMGDVHPMYGVCTDVIIRAYRTLGIDLQELVQKTRTGSGDPNIDHRRVETLRKFFARFGEVLPVSSFAEDYRPGDIVTYWRPQNRNSRTHIAIVSDLSGPSGRPLIIHNRGWGPQHEDGLFVDKITGHYRFTGLRQAPAVSNPAGGAKGAKRAAIQDNSYRSQVARTGLPTEVGSSQTALPTTGSIR